MRPACVVRTIGGETVARAALGTERAGEGTGGVVSIRAMSSPHHPLCATSRRRVDERGGETRRRQERQQTASSPRTLSEAAHGPQLVLGHPIGRVRADGVPLVTRRPLRPRQLGALSVRQRTAVLLDAAGAEVPEPNPARSGGGGGGAACGEGWTITISPCERGSLPRNEGKGGTKVGRQEW